MKVGDYYRGPSNTYHKIVGEKENKFIILDLSFPAYGPIKATKTVVEYACEKVPEKEVLEWCVDHILTQNDTSIQDKMDEVKNILNDIKRELKVIQQENAVE